VDESEPTVPTVIRCPSCDRPLRMPENLVGSKVRCPGCQAAFTAEAPGEADAPAPSPSAVTDRPSRAPAERPSSAARRPPESEDEPDFEDDAGDEPEDEERPRRRRGGRARETALGMVAGPGIALMVIGILGIVFGVVGVGAWILLGGMLAMQPAGPGMGPGARPGVPAPPGAQGADAMIGVATNIASGLGSIVFGGIMTYGGMQLKSLGSKGWARAAGIIAVVPCLTCCLYGLPIGIWSLVVMNKPEVADAFRS
jgi:hypothetical protein